MLFTFAGVDLPYHSSDFLLDSMRGYFGRFGSNADRNLFAGAYTFKLNLNGCLPGIGGTTEGFNSDRLGTLINDASFFVDGETYAKIMASVDRAYGFGGLVLSDDAVTLNLGTMFLARRILIRDGLIDRERVWMLTLFNGNDFYRNTSNTLQFPLGTANQQIYPEYLVDSPEPYANAARYSSAVDLGNYWLSSGMVFGLQVRPRLNLADDGKTYSYGMPRTISLASANAILDRNFRDWGNRIVHGSILPKEIDGADFNRRESVLVAWQNVNASGALQSSGTTTVYLKDTYPAIRPWPQAAGGIVTGFPTAIAVGSSAAQNLAGHYGKSWYRWHAIANRIQGGQPGFFSRRWDELPTTCLTFAGLVPWNFCGVEGAVYFLAGAGEWEQPCTVVTTASPIHNHSHRLAAALAQPINAARTLGTITGTAPVGMSAATVARTATGNTVSAFPGGSPRTYTLTGVPDGEYTVTRVGTASPTSVTVTVKDGSTETANFS